MQMTELEQLQRLCAQYGIVDDYYDIRGVQHIVGEAARRRLLAAMQVEAADAAEVDASLEVRRRSDWTTAIAPALVYREGEDSHQVVLTLELSHFERPLHWRIDSETGERFHGSWQFTIDQVEEETEIDGQRRLRLRAALPARTGPGYHRLSLQLGDTVVAASLIVAPQTCYLPTVIDADERCWGISLQLYALRSRRNWGIGDFTDLRAAVVALAPLGIDCIGLNPLHALFPHRPESASPYSPSSRDFINPLYLDIEVIADFEHAADARRLVRERDFQARLKALRETCRVDYSGVARSKHEVLQLLYRRFRLELDEPLSTRARDFREFQRRGGEALFDFALFEALQAFFHQQDSRLQSWQQWPAPFHNPASSAVVEWIDAHRPDIEFHQYLQWQAELQLTAVQQDCADLGLRIGLYNDLAVGNARASAQCWTQPELYARGVGIGAPPDDFSPAGQDWGLPPPLPERMRDEAYLSFRRSLRANMRHAGALRIDHVMALLRLYWVPDGVAADQGTYVRYSFDDLLGIVALESHRNRCLVIGEDLGTVPDEVRHALWVNRMLSYRILLFEKDWHAGSFLPPADYPRLALCASGSHDLPTLRGFWKEADLDLRESLRLYSDDEIAPRQRELRKRDKAELLSALARENLLASEAQQAAAAADDLGEELLIAVQSFLARTSSCLVMLQLEDLLGQQQQVNLPGTIEQYANWRHKVGFDVESWCANEPLLRIARAVARERGANTG